MPWNLIGVVAKLLLGFFSGRKERKSKAQQQIAKLSHRMDSMAKKHAELRMQNEVKMEALIKKYESSLEVKQKSE